MILDHNHVKDLFFLRVPRGEPGIDITELQLSHGLDFSTTASTPEEAVFFTAEPYAAVAFAKYATPAALAQLSGILATVEASWALDNPANFRVPADKELWPFQKASLAYALARPNTLIGDEPGLGKTQIAIAFANEIKAKRVLVICPANIRLQWQTRIREWSTMPHPIMVDAVTVGKHGVSPEASWVVISYDLARRPGIREALAAQHFDLLVLDEAHYLKNNDTKRTHVILHATKDDPIPALLSRADRCLCLTGTPLPNRPREAYTLARGLCWDAIDWQSEAAFRERFNPSFIHETAKGQRWVEEHSGRHAELQARLRGNFMVRHLKRAVMTQLRLPVYDLVYLEQTRAVKAALDAESLLAIDPDCLEGCNAEVLGHISVVRHQMGVAIAPQVADYVDMLLEGGETKIVLFAWHIDVLDILCERLARWLPIRIDGATPAKRKQELVDLFQSDPKRQLIIGNTQSMGTGTDGLQYVSNHALIAEPDWVHGVNVQCFDRLDRGGQTRQVQGDLFVVQGSLAERILASALRKGQIVHDTLDRRVQ